MKKALAAVILVVLVFAGCSAPQTSTVSSEAEPFSLISSVGMPEKVPVLAGMGSGDEMKAESFVYADSLPLVITEVYYTKSKLSFGNFLLTDSGVGVNLNGYKLLDQEIVVSKDGQSVQFVVAYGEYGQNESVWRLGADGELVCVAEECEEMYRPWWGIMALAYVKDGELFYFPPSAEQALNLGPVKMMPDNMAWTERGNVVFSRSGEWIMFENDLGLYSANSAGEVRYHAKLDANYMLSGISDDGNLMFYGRELYESRKEEGEQDRNCELTVLDVANPQNNATVNVGSYCYSIFNKDENEVFVGGGNRFYLYTRQNGLWRISAPYDETSEYEGHVFEFNLNGEHITNHTGGWPPPGLMFYYAQTEHFTCYYFYGRENDAIYYQPFDAPKPVWRWEDKRIEAVSPGDNNALLSDEEGGYWLVGPDKNGQMQQEQVKPDDERVAWSEIAPQQESVFKWDNEKQELWLEKGDMRVLLWKK